MDLGDRRDLLGSFSGTVVSLVRCGVFFVSLASLLPTLPAINDEDVTCFTT